MSEPQSCGQCECCAAWRNERDQQRERAERLERERDDAIEALKKLGDGEPELAKILLGELYLDRFKTERVDPHNELVATRRERDAANALLQRVEWLSDERGRVFCPACWASWSLERRRDRTHVATCALAAHLRGEPTESTP